MIHDCTTFNSTYIPIYILVSAYMHESPHAKINCGVKRFRVAQMFVTGCASRIASLRMQQAEEGQRKCVDDLTTFVLLVHMPGGQEVQRLRLDCIFR